MALVAGEDSESDEEINTEHLQSLVLTPDGSLTGPGYRGLARASQGATAGIVMGEESETDEEEEDGSVDQPDGGGDGGGGAPAVTASLQSSLTSAEGAQDAEREESSEATDSAPKSLLHKKLRERNQSLRRNIVERIIKLYRITCKNLTLVNTNLSKAQGTIETVNSNLKRSEHELSELNTTIAEINLDARAVAPHLSITLHKGPKKSPSPMRQKLLKGVPKAFRGPLRSAPEKQQARIPEACPGGQEAEKQSGGQGSGVKEPERSEA